MWEVGGRSEIDAEGELGEGAGFGFERDERGSQDGSYDDGPSRADASDSWGADKKAFVPSDRPGSRSTSSFGASRREGSDDGRDDGGVVGRSDTAGEWGRNAFVPSTRDPPRRREDGDYSAGEGGPSKADTEDRWSKKAYVPSEAPARREGGGGFSDAGGDRCWGPVLLPGPGLFA